MIEIPERAASLHISEVILWTNGMVMVFDDRGQQMCHYQGSYRNVVHAINAVYRGQWHYGDWRRGLIAERPWLPHVRILLEYEREVR